MTEHGNGSSSISCTRSHISASDVFDGDITIKEYDPLSNNEFPKMARLNASSWELWFFDAVSDSGDAAVTISFFRDGSGTAMNKGILRTSFHAVFLDGSTFGKEYFAEDSVFESLPSETITSAWTGKEGNAFFEIGQDLKEAVVKFDTPEIKGPFSMSSAAAPFVPGPCGDVGPDAGLKHMLAPTIHWLQPIPRASVEAKFMIQGKELEFVGAGGHDRFWTPFSWPTLMDESYYMRAIAGPYTVILLRIISRIEVGRPRGTILLFDGGKQIFTSQSEQISLGEDYFSFKLSHHGSVKGAFRDSNTGYMLDLVAPGKGKHWRFELDHERVWWNMPTGPVTGNTGFVDKVSGGEVGGKQYHGAGSAGQCQLAANR